jgi:hypothetical protein
MNTIIGILLLSVFLIFVITILVHKPKSYPTSLEGAKEVLSHIQEWAKWISGIQTLTIAALAWFVLGDKREITIRGETQYFFAILAFVCIGAALYFSAWILASVPSQSIRIHTHPANVPGNHFDVYEQKLLGRKGPTLGYFLTLNHWYWGVGLLSFGILIVIKMICESNPVCN